MPEERLLLGMFNSSSFVVVYLVTRSTRSLALYSVKIGSITKGLAMRKWVLVFGQGLLKQPVGYTPIKPIFVQKLMYRSSRIWIIPTHQKANHLDSLRKMYQLTDWHLDMPSVAAVPCQKSGNNIQLNFRCKGKECISLSWQYNLKLSNFQFSLFNILINTERFNKTLCGTLCFLTVLSISFQLLRNLY